MTGVQATRKTIRWGRTHMILWISLVMLGLLFSLYAIRFLEIRRINHDLATLKSEETLAFAMQQELRSRLALKDDPATIELSAREQLGLIKPGEEKVIFIKGE